MTRLESHISQLADDWLFLTRTIFTKFSYRWRQSQKHDVSCIYVLKKSSSRKCRASNGAFATDLHWAIQRPPFFFKRAGVQLEDCNFAARYLIEFICFVCRLLFKFLNIVFLFVCPTFDLFFRKYQFALTCSMSYDCWPLLLGFR